MKRYGLVLVCVAVLFSSVSLLVGSLAMRPGGSLGELGAARARWLAQAPPHYSLQIDEQSLGVVCHQELEIQHDRILAIVQNTCDHMPWTIDSLFDRVEHDLVRSTALLSACVVAGCACARTPIFRATYDATLGYPHERRVGVELAPNWLHRDFWLVALRQRRLPECNFAVDREVLMVRVRPVPSSGQTRAMVVRHGLVRTEGYMRCSERSGSWSCLGWRSPAATRRQSASPIWLSR
jgi:hypothetical protein